MEIPHSFIGERVSVRMIRQPSLVYTGVVTKASQGGRLVLMPAFNERTKQDLSLIMVSSNEAVIEVVHSHDIPHLNGNVNSQ